MYTLKVFNSFFWDTTVNKINEIRNIEIEQFIDSFDILNLNIDYYTDDENNLNCSGLRELQKIQLIKTGLIDQIIFEGYIYNLRPNFKSATLQCRDFKGLLDNKVLFDLKNYSNKSLDFILNDLLTDLNGRSSGDTNPENWTYDIDAPVTGITKEFKKGLSYFNIFKELGVIANKNWTVEQGTILFKEILGTDKTSGESFTEFIFDKNAPDENNISDIRVDRFGTLKNRILTSVTDEENTTSKDEFWRLETYNDIEGDELTNELSRISKTQTAHVFDIDYSRVNTEPKLGDKIRVFIDSGIDLLDITGDLFITRRKVKLLWWENVVTNVDVSEITIKKTNFVKTLNDLQDEVKKLLLQ